MRRGTVVWSVGPISDFRFSRCVRTGRIGRWITSILVIVLSDSPRVSSFVSVHARRYLISSSLWCIIVSIIAWTCEYVDLFIAEFSRVVRARARARATYSISQHVPICIFLGLCGKCVLYYNAPWRVWYFYLCDIANSENVRNRRHVILTNATVYCVALGRTIFPFSSLLRPLPPPPSPPPCIPPERQLLPVKMSGCYRHRRVTQYLNLYF